ncbi:MAG: hypothetical protein JJT95_15390, partial [Pararhodobacter sp.]|nr:hypothetical protein [Pararhodobacter sp.]
MRNPVAGRHRTLLAVIALAQAVVFGVILAVGLVTIRQYERAIAEYSAARSLVAGEQAVDTLLWQDHAALMQRIAAEFARELQPRMNDEGALARHLARLLQQADNGNHGLMLLGAGLHRADGSLIAQNWPGAGAPALPVTLPEAIAGREPGARLHPLLHGWTGETGPVLSTIVPVNGRAALGFLVLHADPAMALRVLDRHLAMPVRLLDGAGREMLRSGEFAQDANPASAGARFDVAASDGSTLMQVEIIEDRRALHNATIGARRIAMMLIVGVVGTLSLIVVVGRWRPHPPPDAREPQNAPQ